MAPAAAAIHTCFIIICPHVHSSRLSPCHVTDTEHMPEQEDEENGIGDVDLFTLSEDKTELTVNAKWLQHLQVRACPALLFGFNVGLDHKPYRRCSFLGCCSQAGMQPLLM